jgi:hypothetical protein
VVHHFNGYTYVATPADPNVVVDLAHLRALPEGTRVQVFYGSAPISVVMEKRSGAVWAARNGDGSWAGDVQETTLWNALGNCPRGSQWHIVGLPTGADFDAILRRMREAPTAAVGPAKPKPAVKKKPCNFQKVQEHAGYALVEHGPTGVRKWIPSADFTPDDPERVAGAHYDADPHFDPSGV